MNKYLHPEDASIIREDKAAVGDVLLQDADGRTLFTFPKDWSDDQIMCAVAFANKAYEVGVGMGKYYKETEIKRTLGIAEDIEEAIRRADKWRKLR